MSFWQLISVPSSLTSLFTLVDIFLLSETSDFKVFQSFLGRFFIIQKNFLELFLLKFTFHLILVVPLEFEILLIIDGFSFFSFLFKISLSSMTFKKSLVTHASHLPLIFWVTKRACFLATVFIPLLKIS